MTLYIIILRKKGGRLTIESQRALWIGFQRSYEVSREKALEIYPKFEPVFYSEIKWFELWNLLPFTNRKQK